MHTLLIVDDEPVITESLYELFIGSEMDFDVYTAFSGREAMSLMDRVGADVVLTDIRMPGTTGIDLLHYVSKTWPQSKVIFLTGHDDFAYAQAAIRGGSVDYVLKSEDDSVLLDAVHEAIERIEAELVSAELVERAREHHALASELLCSKYLERILSGDPPTSSDFGALKLDLDPERNLLLVVGERSKRDAFSEAVGDSVEPIVSEYLDPVFRLATNRRPNGSWVWLAQPREMIDDEDWTRHYSFISKALQKAQRSCSELLGVTVSFIVTAENCAWADIGRRFERLARLLKCSRMIESESVITDSFAERFLQQTCDIENRRLRTLMNTAPPIEVLLDEGDAQQIHRWIDKVTDYLSGITDYPTIVETYYTIALSFLKYCNDLRLEAGLPPEFHSDQLMDIEKRGSLDDIRTYLHRMTRAVIAHSFEMRGTQTDKLIEHLHRHISSNLDSDLSLARLAEMVSLNASYLSRLYRKLTGGTLTCYINSARLKRACELLRNTKKHVCDIGRSVGYDIPAHFTRFFRRMTDSTPQEYRRLHGM